MSAYLDSQEVKLTFLFHFFCELDVAANIVEISYKCFQGSLSMLSNDSYKHAHTRRTRDCGGFLLDVSQLSGGEQRRTSMTPICMCTFQLEECFAAEQR